jgi:hypothetical protein
MTCFFNQTPERKVILDGNAGCWINYSIDVYANLKNGNGFAIRNIKKLADELNKTSCNTVVMSAENFSWIFSGDHIVKLKLALAQYFDVNIFLYIRRQDQLVISHVQ